MADDRGDTGRCGPWVLYARAMRCRLAPSPSAIARCALLVLSMALLAAAGRLIDIGSVGADGHETDEQALAETQVVADVPSEYGDLFSLEWGGGSLYHLKGRLATMGCLVNTIWLYEEGEWQAYNQYEVPSTLTREFVDRYAEFVPAGTLYATCFRLCEFTYFGEPQRSCLTLQDAIRVIRKPGFPIDAAWPCTHDFSPWYAQYVLPNLPVLPEACVIHDPDPETTPGTGGFASSVFLRFSGSITVPVNHPFVLLVPLHWGNDLSAMLNRAHEAHEWCHINQYWHSVQNLQPDRVLREHPNDLWYGTPAGIDLITLTGFSRDEDGQWMLPEGHALQGWYSSTKPKELAAEFCAHYFMERYRSKSGLSDAKWDRWVNFRAPRETEILQLAEIVQWLETYVVLPEISE